MTEPRRRLREWGVGLGRFAPGPYNAITDVRGVRVGHATLDEDAPAGGRGPVRTGVTAILPNNNDIFMDRMVAGSFILNGAGEMSGLIQVQEWGLLETPILLTNTLSVGRVSEAAMQYMLAQHPGIGSEQDVVIPLVGECDDSFLNDIAGGHIQPEHVYEALSGAASGPVAEGNVGAGTGMISFDFKGGLGTASRIVPDEDGDYVLGVLVQSNLGRMEDLRIDGVAVGPWLVQEYGHLNKRKSLYGSVIAVLATDAPLSAPQLNRLCKRVALGIGRVGSYAAHGSGEIILGFSTANVIPRNKRSKRHTFTFLSDRCVDPLYQAAIECTEEAILNALCMAQGMSGVSDHYAPALPIEQLMPRLARLRF